MQDLFGNDTSTARQVDAKRAKLRESIRRIHGLVVGLPAAADDATRAVAERVKRAKATELSKIAAELNRQEIQDLQAKAHKGAAPPLSPHCGVPLAGAQTHRCILTHLRMRYQQLHASST